MTNTTITKPWYFTDKKTSVATVGLASIVVIVVAVVCYATTILR